MTYFNGMSAVYLSERRMNASVLYMGFEVLTVVKIPIIIFSHEEGDSLFLRNFSRHLLIQMASQPERPHSTSEQLVLFLTPVVLGLSLYLQPTVVF